MFMTGWLNVACKQNYWIVINGGSHKLHINYVTWYEIITFLLSIYATNTMHAI